MEGKDIDKQNANNQHMVTIILDDGINGNIQTVVPVVAVSKLVGMETKTSELNAGITTQLVGIETSITDAQSLVQNRSGKIRIDTATRIVAIIVEKLNTY